MIEKIISGILALRFVRPVLSGTGMVARSSGDAEPDRLVTIRRLWEPVALSLNCPV